MISVCMASRNGENFIKEQITSILCQLDKNDELIISDDSSTDNTISVINSLTDSRIKLIQHIPKDKEHKYGNGFYYATANFENALNHASGDIIFLSDQDDLWYENKVNECVEELKRNDLVLTNFSIIDKDGKKQKDRFLSFNPVNGSLLRTVATCKMQGCTMAFKRSVLDKALPFPNDLMLHDAWLCLIAKKYFSVSYIDVPLIFYRRTGTNVSTSSGKSKNPIWFRIFFRLKLLFQILAR